MEKWLFRWFENYFVQPNGILCITHAKDDAGFYFQKWLKRDILKCLSELFWLISIKVEWYRHGQRISFTTWLFTPHVKQYWKFSMKRISNIALNKDIWPYFSFVYSWEALWTQDTVSKCQSVNFYKCIVKINWHIAFFHCV